MPVYVFKAKIPGGKQIKGEVSANDETEARVKIRAQNLMPVSLVPKGVKGPNKGASMTGSVTSKELQVMTRQFATLINSGIPIVQSLEILGNGTRNTSLKNTLFKIKEDISQGRRLGDAMMPHKKIFSKLYINLVKAGEEGGILDEILNRLATYIEKSEKIMQKVKGAMFYPIGVLCVSALVIGVIMVYVIPKFEELFAASGKELPYLTQVVMHMSHFFRDYWYFIIGGILFAYVAFKQYYATEGGKAIFDEIFIRMPIVGSIIQKSEVARFSRTLSTLLTSGVSLLEALDISAESVGNSVVERTIKQAKAVIQQGKSIVIPFSKNPYMPDMVVQMIGVGEQTGSLDSMLGKVADFYEEEVDYAVGAATTMIEPIMMVFLGGTIAFLVIAMYLPIFDLASAV